MNEWHDLFAATCGSAAALTGLIFVGVSINLTKILSIPNLPERAMLSLIFLMTILIESIYFLIPGQSLAAAGVEVLITGSLIWICTTALEKNIYKKTPVEFRRLFFYHFISNQLAIFPYLISGILLLSSKESGLYWVVPGFILCFIKAIWDSWVLLVEINR
jgi:hypothetical protein